jgi:hypothetical protein
LKIGIKTVLLGLAAAAVIAKPGFSFASGLKGTDTTINQNSTSFTQIVAFNDDSGDDNSGIVTQDQPQVQQQDQQDENNQPQVQNGGDDQQSITDQNNGDDQSGSEDSGNSSDDSDEE